MPTKQHLHRTQVQVSRLYFGSVIASVAEFTLSEANVLPRNNTLCPSIECVHLSTFDDHAHRVIANAINDIFEGRHIPDLNVG